MAGVFPEDIIAASFINSVWKVPYYAAYDSKEKRLIVAVRGTLSLQVRTGYGLENLIEHLKCRML